MFTRIQWPIQMIRVIDQDNSQKIPTGNYNSLEDLVSEIVRIAKLKQFDRKFDMITQQLVLTFGEKEGLSFQDDEIPSILGFKGTPDLAHNGFVHIGYKTNFENGPQTLLTDILVFSLLI